MIDEIKLHCFIAEEHRELVRKCLYALLSSGYSPLDFFDRDYKSYFLMAETLSVVDLSLVTPVKLSSL
jgi:hypothetical protein